MMRPRPWTTIVLLLLVITPALAQAQSQPGQRDIGDFPSCGSSIDGVMLIALDPEDGDDCTNGGGTDEPHPCVCDGDASTWERAQRDSLLWDAPWDRLVIGSDGPGDGMVIAPADGPLAVVDAVDDGRSRGGGLVCSATFCITGDCTEGQGDCADLDGRCSSGLFCRQNIGRLHDPTTDQSLCADTDDICLPSDSWCSYTCTSDDPCEQLQGDCGGSDSNCQAGLVCGIDEGATWDCGASVDICRSPDATVCDVDALYLTEGQGDCTNEFGDTPCATGLTCTGNVGSYYGCPPTTAICES